MAVVNLENEELTRLLQEDPEIQLLDVRTPEEYFGLGHIPGSRLLPIYELPAQIPTLNSKVPTVVVCEHGVRSTDASYYLVHNGFEKVYHLAAGMAEWNGPREYASN